MGYKVLGQHLLSCMLSMLLLSLVSDQGFETPFAHEVIPYAIARQQLEDGPSKPPTVSAVGMYPGGTNKEVMEQLCLEWHGHKVSTVTDSEGQGCYMINGPRAQDWGVVCVLLVWDKYINSGKFSFPEHLKHAWNESKRISWMFKHVKTLPLSDLFGNYERLRIDRIKAIEKVNNMYGPGGEDLNRKLKQKENELGREQKM